MLKKRGSQAALAVVDASFELPLAIKHGIQAYPTLVVFGSGIELAKYAGKPTSTALRDFVLRHEELEMSRISADNEEKNGSDQG